jgi:hypothetical protein
MDLSTGRVSSSARPISVARSKRTSKSRRPSRKKRTLFAPQRKVYSSNPPKCNKMPLLSSCGYGPYDNSDDYDNGYDGYDGYGCGGGLNIFPPIPMSPYPPWGPNTMYPYPSFGPGPICNDNGASMPLPMSMVPTPGWFPMSNREYPITCGTPAPFPVAPFPAPTPYSGPGPMPCSGPPMMLPPPQYVLPNAVPTLNGFCSRVPFYS